MEFHELKKYHQGKGPNGTELFHIPLKVDDRDGMVGRECQNEACVTKYFKIKPEIPEKMKEAIPNLTEAVLVCPYCTSENHLNKLITDGQMEYVKSMMVKDMHKNVQDVLSRVFGKSSSSSGGFISMKMTYKPGRLPNIRPYVEEKLKRHVTCDKCGFQYAVYGISFYCPLCKEGNLLVHLERNTAMLTTMIDDAGQRMTTDQEVGDQMLGNALEDVVTLFESFLKQLYIYKIKTMKANPAEAEEAIKKIGISFQRLQGAADFYKDDLSHNLFSVLTESERDALELQFMKRHILTHNLGMVDAKFLAKTGIQVREGAEVDLDKDEVKQALNTVVKVISNTISTLLI